MTQKKNKNYNMILEVWENELEDEDGIFINYTAFPSTHTEEMKKQLLGDGKHTKLREIEGKNWEECMAKHYQLMGWEPYQPMKYSE